jgi:hypothetical protein
MAITPDEVRAITGSTLTDDEIQPFITAAGCLLGRVTDCMGFSEGDCYDQTEAYLSAHLLVSSNIGKDSAPLKREMLLNEYEVEYIVSKGGTGILSTPFGETANMLSGGCLVNLDKIQPSFHGLGCI